MGYRNEITEINLRTKIVHQPIVTGGRSRVQPSVGPSPIIIGSMLGFEFSNPATDALLSEFKVPTSHDGAYSAFHVHWTKSTDAIETGNSVRWQIDLTQFDGASGDVNVSPLTIVFDDVYDDAGSTTRIIHRTSDVAIPDGLTPGWYVGIKVTAVAGMTTLSGNPVLFSADLRISEEINR